MTNNGIRIDSTTKRNISFSPPDISELEIKEVAEALRSDLVII